MAYIVYASLKTLINAPQIAAPHVALLRAHLYVLAGVEVRAAFGLLIRRLAGAATLGLLGVFTVAALIDLALGEFPAHLLLYAAVTLLLHNCASLGARAPAVAASGGF